VEEIIGMHGIETRIGMTGTGKESARGIGGMEGLAALTTAETGASGREVGPLVATKVRATGTVLGGVVCRVGGWE
jgi:hypothetical protein